MSRLRKRRYAPESFCTAAPARQSLQGGHSHSFLLSFRRKGRKGNRSTDIFECRRGYEHRCREVFFPERQKCISFEWIFHHIFNHLYFYHTRNRAELQLLFLPYFVRSAQGIRRPERQQADTRTGTRLPVFRELADAFAVPVSISCRPASARS